jgi:hypothetical protein
MADKQEDDEIVLQITYTLYRYFLAAFTPGGLSIVSGTPCFGTDSLGALLLLWEDILHSFVLALSVWWQAQSCLLLKERLPRSCLRLKERLSRSCLRRRCLQHECTRVILLEQTQVVSYFVDLLYDKNGEIRKMADQTLDLVMEFDDEWATQIRYSTGIDCWKIDV